VKHNAKTMIVETSIIVRTFNEEKHLGNLFDGFDRQTYRDFEVIVVDSGSFDRTRDIAEERADKLIRINSHDFTFGYSLNRGIKESKGKFIAIVSAHVIPVDDYWLEKLIKPLQQDKVAMAYGQQRGIACSKFSEAEDYRRIFGIKPKIEDPSRFSVNNANSAIKKILWDKQNFDETLTGLEDIAWARHWMERKYQVIYEPSAAIYHIHEETWRQVRHRFYREAVAFRKMGLKSPATIPRELLREVVRLFDDLFRALLVKENPVVERLSLGQRIREILYFRINMNFGALKGLLEKHPLNTRESRELTFFDRRAKGVLIHKPNQAAFEEIELPGIKPGDALIRVSHVAICATDIEIFNGTLGYYKNGMGDYPIVPGHEFSGRIVNVGQNVMGLNEDDPVVVECIQSCGSCRNCLCGNFIGCVERSELGVLRRNGAYAEYVVAPAKFVHKIPMNMDLRVATLCEPLAVILKGLRRVNLSSVSSGAKPMECAVLGSGPLGHMCALVLAHQGHSVTAFDRNPKRRLLFDSTTIKTTDDLSKLHRFNIIVEITGDPEVLSRALHESPANATLLLLGLPYGERPFSFEAVAAYDKTVTGSVGSTAEDFKAAIKLLPKLHLEPYFQCPMALEDFHSAWDKSRQGDVLKVILDV
jgi:threonine dehydrogenase-like Zn-dependent dehydrogenase/GT2 family glycosyltransferase